MEYDVLQDRLSITYLGTATDLSQTPANDSASRQTMMSQHVAQMLVINGATPRRFKTGSESEYAKTTFKVSLPVDAKIIKVVKKYPSGVGASAFRSNSETVVIYEDLEAKTKGIYRLGMVSITGYHCKHQSFGFKYRMTEAINQLVPGQIVLKDTIFAQSPNVAPNGDYMYGLEAEVAFMSIPQIIEDGVVISKSLAQKMATTAISSRMVSYGSEYYLLNLYGDENNYKPFPDIGERIREDGLLFALRQYDPLLAICEMTPAALMDYDDVYDRLVFARPGAIVTDVNVWTDYTQRVLKTPVGMDEQPRRYIRSMSNFYSTILKTWQDYHRAHRGQRVECTEELHRLLVDCLADNPNTVKQSVTRTYRTQPLDEFTVEIKFAKEVVPTIGFKLTDLHGGKGVIVDVWDDEDMPVDQWGNRADIIMDGDSTIKRMNIGRMYEQYINASSRWVTTWAKEHVAANNDPGAYELLRKYYSIASPLMFEQLVQKNLTSLEKWKRHLDYVCRDGVSLWVPPDSPNLGDAVIRELMRELPIPVGPVTYRGRSGKMRTTKANVLIGSLYIIELEKTGEDWSAVSSARRQHYGILARLTNRDKYARPGREQPVRILGEAEVRLLVAYSGPMITADLLEYPNNPAIQKEVARQFLTAPKPTAIATIIDRTKYRRGTSRALQFVKHIVECGGVRYTNK